MSERASTWVYVRSEPGLYTVGFYAPDGRWHSDSDHETANGAAARVAWLNGGPVAAVEIGAALVATQEALKALHAELDATRDRVSAIAGQVRELVRRS